MPKDGTAQGVAKVRHWESMFPPDQQLYHDPYAYACYPGSFVQKWMGTGVVDALYRWMNLTGLQEMITVRTKHIDEQVELAISQDGEEGVKQLVILGAGYDTRGFRLNKLPTTDFTVLEVDQPEVQEKKKAVLQHLIKKNNEDGNRIKDRLDSNMIQFVPIDFNKDSLEEKLKSHDGFQVNQKSIIILEGVTQYIPKESTADTLRQLKTLVAPGSTLITTYVDQKVFSDPSTLPKNIQTITSLVSKAGEPWISGWEQNEFKVFLKDCGYQALSDTDCSDHNDTYLGPVKRKMEEKDILDIERFVVAKLL